MKIPNANAAFDKELDKLKNTPAWQESKSPKKVRGDREPEAWGPQGVLITGGGGPACVLSPLPLVGTRRGGGRINVLPWYRLVVVAKYLQ